MLQNVTFKTSRVNTFLCQQTRQALDKEVFGNAFRNVEKWFIHYELQSSDTGHDGQISSTFLLILIVTSPFQVSHLFPTNCIYLLQTIYMYIQQNLLSCTSIHITLTSIILQRITEKKNKNVEVNATQRQPLVTHLPNISILTLAFSWQQIHKHIATVRDSNIHKSVPQHFQSITSSGHTVAAEGMLTDQKENKIT